MMAGAPLARANSHRGDPDSDSDPDILHSLQKLPSRPSASLSRVAVRRVSDPPRRVGEGVNESFGPIVPALQASILFFARNHALTRVATPCRRFAPLFYAHSANRNPASHFEASLEEAVQ